MKTKSLFFIALMLLVGSGLMAQNYTFRVLTAKGNNTANSKTIRVGSKLQANDQIEMEQGGYLGLLHNNGQTLELRTKGTYKVGELANNIKASSNSSLTSRYANYVVSELTSVSEEADGQNRYKHMSKTGAVVRGVIMPITVIEPKKIVAVGDEVEVTWFVFEELANIKQDDVKNYKVTVTDFSGNELFSEMTDKTSYTIDLTRPELVDQKSILYKVVVADEDKQNGNVVYSSPQSIVRGKKSKKDREELALIGDDSALGHLIRAQYLEDKGYYAEAAMAYRNAIQLAPEVETYRILYSSFQERTEMSEKALREKAKSRNTESTTSGE